MFGYMSKHTTKLNLRRRQPMMPTDQQVTGFAACSQSTGCIDVGDLFQEFQGPICILEPRGGTGRQENAVGPIRVAAQNGSRPLIRLVKLQVLQGDLAKVKFQVRTKRTSGQCSDAQQQRTGQEEYGPFGPWFLFGHNGARNKGNTQQENRHVASLPS